MKILIYDENFHTIYNTVQYILPIVELLTRKNEVVLLGDQYFEPSYFKKFYNMDIGKIDCMYLNPDYSNLRIISHWKHIKKCRAISDITSNYEVFINNVFDNHWQINPQAKKTNICVAHIPVNPYHRWQHKEAFKKIKNYARDLLLSSPKDFNFIDSYNKRYSISDFSCQWFRKYWNIQDISTVYPWIDTLKKSKDIPKSNIILAVVGLRLDNSQNIDRIMESFKNVLKETSEDWSLHIAFNIRALNTKKAFSHIAKLKRLIGRSQIYFHINLDKARMDKLYGMSKILWNITGMGFDESECFEAFGIETLEAMNNLCVPVVINAGGIREIVEENNSGLLVNSIEELEHKTLFLIKKPEILKELAKNAYNRSLFFSKERFIFQFKEHLKELM